MTQTQYQRGYLYRKNGGWHVRFREFVRGENGSVVTVHRSPRIASTHEYPRKSEVQPLADQLMIRCAHSQMGGICQCFAESRKPPR